jgi:hypothetical protein
MPSRLLQFALLAGLMLMVCSVIALAVVLVNFDLFDLRLSAPEEPFELSQATPKPTFTPTFTPEPATFTPIPTPTASPTLTPTTTLTPTATLTPTTATATPAPPEPVEPTAPPVEPTAPPAPPPAAQPAVDFVVVQQRMRSNAENIQGGKTINNCGLDHTIYIQVVDAAGNPLTGVIVGDTYHNIRTASGADGPGRLKIELWSNTMAMEVQGNIDGTPYTSEQTLPLSTRDEDIPVEWLFEGGYCGSIDECRLRQQTNGLCRGHYSYDVTFQRTW